MIERTAVIESLIKVIDPELMINIVDLGLIEGIRIQEDRIEVDFLVTYPGCPLAPEIERNIVNTLKEDTGLEKIWPTVLWSKPWDPSRMTEEARFAMGYPV
ncbi:MAG: metal-sulfur cluster assembly factor [Spirochaetaceae bacterium]|jgi:metal-sulfur cluster biosynthetic enzyme|nr:metal-sulfur cluster assembly factor [Spirochaetaceae bacterium]